LFEFYTKLNILNDYFLTVDTPDPYIMLRIKTAPEGKRRTKTIDNDVNPVWEEDFEFLLDQNENNVLREYFNIIISKYTN